MNSFTKSYNFGYHSTDDRLKSNNSFILTTKNLGNKIFGWKVKIVNPKFFSGKIQKILAWFFGAASWQITEKNYTNFWYKHNLKNPSELSAENLARIARIFLTFCW